MIDYIKNFIRWIKCFPVIYRVFLLLCVASFLFICTMTSCGQLVKVTVKDTPNGVSITTSQTKKDSSSTNISVNPNITFSK